YERGAEDSSGEFRIKARGVVRELSSIFHFKELLNPLKYPMLSLVLILHRILRWSVPIFLIALFLINLKLLEIPYYRIFFWMQVSFYLFASIGFLLEFYQLPIISNQLLKVKQILGLPFYFCLVNIAAMWGIVQFILGKKKAVWEPVR
ncbi:MAG: hypothetical protein ACE5H1_06080, partial [Thermodesulfobacteriota bacterium]